MRPLKSDGQYVNPVPTAMGLNGGFWETLREWFGGDQVREPKEPLLADSVDLHKALPAGQDGLHVTWLGHSTLLVQMDGVRILFDPVFGNDVSPVSWLYSIKRFQAATPVAIAELPFIDAVFLTHDHYDHLDKKSILELAPKVGVFLTPLGVGDRLVEWGVNPAQVRQSTWWQSDTLRTRFGSDLTFTCTPARHFSGRGLTDRNKTLWASWALQGKAHKIFHSGDSGYGPHFAQIGEQLGPFDLTMIENGQYNDKWRDIHMKPEESVQAHLDLGGAAMIPIHWGSFNLSIHDWWEPIERARMAATRKNVLLWTPRVGQTLSVDEQPLTMAWWENFTVEPADTLVSLSR